jgi:hypothetical protein
MSNENAPEIADAKPAVGGPVQQMVRPRAFLCEYRFRGNVRHELTEELPTHAGVESAMMEPLYARSALDAAVAAERERCARLCEHRVDTALGYVLGPDCAALIRGA